MALQMSVPRTDGGDPSPRTTEVVLVHLPGLDTWDGQSWVFSTDNGTQPQPDFAIHSAHIPDGMLLSVYPAPNFGGMPTDYTQDTADIGDCQPGGYSFIVRDLLAPPAP